MQHFTRNLIAAAALALLAGCASTGDTTGEDQTGAQQDTTAQPGITAQPEQDATSYAYGQAPSQYDAYNTTTGAQAGGGQAGPAVAGGGQAGPAVAGGGAAPPFRRIASSISASTAPKSCPKARRSSRRTPALWPVTREPSPSWKGTPTSAAAANTTSRWASAAPMPCARP